MRSPTSSEQVLDNQADSNGTYDYDSALDNESADDNESAVDSELAARVHTSLQHVAADHERLDTLFHTLDHNGDGYIDEMELIAYMTSFYGEEERDLEEEARVSYTVHATNRRAVTVWLYYLR